ncbi:hypothetical protein B0H34DRAFT_677701 [Crassisporium funariophilum]|nr:hypothetical protein B0H34DRAFT_677701 [Crassisporium funariophilum]
MSSLASKPPSTTKCPSCCCKDEAKLNDTQLTTSNDCKACRALAESLTKHRLAVGENSKNSKNSKNVSAKYVNGGMSKMLGVVEDVPFSIGAVKTKTNVYVAEKCESNLILGRPWFINHLVSIIEKEEGILLHLEIAMILAMF